MSGEQKIKLGLSLSELTRKVRREGARLTKTSYGIQSRRTA